MKKLLTATLAVALVFGASSASAQFMSVGAATPGGAPTQVFDAGPGATFDLVVTLDTGGESSSAAEFVMTELLLIAPGVFKLSTAKILGTQLDLGDNSVGEYLMAFGDCIPLPNVEMVRINYGNFQGAPGADTVISLRGFGEGDSQPSSFGGELGFIDCADNGFAVPQGGTDGGTTGSGVQFPDGGCVLNPTPVAVPNVDGSVGQLKARF